MMNRLWCVQAFMQYKFLALSLCCWTVACGVLTGAEPVIRDVRPDGTTNRAVWMARGSFGMMTHYLVSPKGDTPEARTADLNRIVDAFDLDGYIRQFDETGADWLIFTMCQGTGYLSTKNEYLDRIEPGYTPRRDLLGELGRAIHARGKHLIVYIPGAHTPADPTVKRLLRSGTEGYTERHNAFIREYSLKMGRLCDGWWFDSCSPQSREAWLAELEACRAGNPDSAVAFSGAEFCASGGHLQPICPLDDYHPGEIHLMEDGRIRTDFIYPPGEEIVISADCKLRKKGQEPRFYAPDSQFIDNVQWHGLLPIDLTFNPAVPNQYCHYTDRELFGFVDRVKSVGGALTINVPIDIVQGHIPDDTHAQLVRLGKYLKAHKTNPAMTPPGQHVGSASGTHP
jgi:hypothetical protein